MAAQILSALCCLLAMIQNAAGSLVLDVNPADIYPGLTQILSVNCSFSFDGVSDIVDIISLIITKENQQGQFDELLSVNVYTPDNIKGAEQLNSTSFVSGHISVDGESFLAIQWSMPTSSEAGRYLCDANGVNDNGQPTEKSQATVVTSQNADLDQLTNKVNDLQGQLDRLESLIQTQSNMIMTQSHLISTLLNTTADLKEKLELQSFFLPFYLSSKYEGHFYLLSKDDWKDSKVAEQTCEDYGGHLAEINNADEQEFVGGFLDSLHGFIYVLVSGTEEGHPGNWTSTYSGGHLGYTNWYHGEPNTVNWSCIDIHRMFNWQWLDIPCTITADGYRFMCEVNLN